jgi:hypothetical protein
LQTLNKKQRVSRKAHPLLKGINIMKKINENNGKMTREELLDKINSIVTDARAKLEQLQNDDSDTAYYLSLDLEKTINQFDSIADYLDGLYDEISYCLDN